MGPEKGVHNLCCVALFVQTDFLVSTFFLSVYLFFFFPCGKFILFPLIQTNPHLLLLRSPRTHQSLPPLHPHNHGVRQQTRFRFKTTEQSPMGRAGGGRR